MKMLETSLESQDGVVYLSFNGWMFEGYEDAKTALLSSILVALGEHERFGPKVKKQIVGLLSRVRWMDVARLGVQHIAAPVAMAALTGGSSAAIGVLGSLATSVLPNLAPSESKPTTTEEGTKPELSWSSLIKAEASEPDLLEVRKFREDFARMLADTDIKSLVILIDDLDRCLPERIIETLEAIKLFVAVPKTAFVVGADERIVRHAISTRYSKRQLDGQESTHKEEYDLTTDYLEKLVQIPYHLPRLSPDEIETYINLLLCQKYLDVTCFATVIDAWTKKREANFYAAFTYGSIQETLQGMEISAELKAQLSWSNAVAGPLSSGLKGTPRQVKRMLNAMVLRSKLAEVADLAIRPEVLAKLMVLEYAHLDRFRDLDTWQTKGKGFPDELKALEEASAKEKMPKDDIYAKWDSPGVMAWLRMEPQLHDLDLRNYFWIARDRIQSGLSAASLVPPFIRELFHQLIGDNDGQRQVAANAVVQLDSASQELLLSLMEQQMQRHPEHDDTSKGFVLLIESDVPYADATLARALREAPFDKLLPGLAPRLNRLGQTKGTFKDHADKLIVEWAKKPDSMIGRAAQTLRESATP